MTNLVIVESPAKCSKIQGFLGQGWKVIASLGHIRHLKQDLEAVGINKDFESSWEFMKDKSCQYAEEELEEEPTKISGKCYRCGREGHYATDCYASKHVKGYFLD